MPEMTPIIVTKLANSLVFCLCIAVIADCMAEQYPARLIRLVVGYSAGGPADARARYLAEQVSKALGKPVVVENKPGAAGSIAAASVASARPDGYTLLYATTDLVLYPALRGKVGYHPVNDFSPVIGLQESGLVLVTHRSLAVPTVGALVALARRTPGQLRYESSGIGSIEHLAGRLFQQVAGLDLVHIPYKGSAPAIIDLVAGRVHLGFEVPLAIAGHVSSGNLRAVMTTSSQRLASLPDVPTAEQAGMPELQLNAPWVGIVAPAGTPKDRIALLNAVFARVRNSAATTSNLLFVDSVNITGSPEEFGRRIANELKRWTALITRFRIRAEPEQRP